MANTERSTYLPGHKVPQVKHHEQRTVENSVAYVLPVLESLRQRNPQLRLLDVGAGSGTISTSLAGHIPDGHVTATDLSDSIVGRARDLARSSGAPANITFQQADAYELPFADASFDAVHTHQMLLHMRAPVDALREMLRLVKPGGVLLASDADLRSWCQWPELPGIARHYEVMLKTHEAVGASVSAGRQLVPWAMAAGAPRESISLTYWMHSFTTPEQRKPMGDSMGERCRSGEIRNKGLEMGIATEAEFDEMAADWDRWAASDEGSLAIGIGQLIVRK